MKLWEKMFASKISADDYRKVMKKHRDQKHSYETMIANLERLNEAILSDLMIPRDVDYIKQQINKYNFNTEEINRIKNGKLPDMRINMKYYKDVLKYRIEQGKLLIFRLDSCNCVWWDDIPNRRLEYESKT